MTYSVQTHVGVLINNAGQFVNGSEQQPLFVHEMLEALGNPVTLFTHDGIDQQNGMKRSDTFHGIPLVLMTPHAISQVDVMIMICHVIDGDPGTDAVRDALVGKRVVKFHCGNHCLFNAEDIVFNTHNVICLLRNSWFSETWVFDMHYFAAEYYELLTKRPTKRMPYVWTPTLLNKYVIDEKLDVVCDPSLYNNTPLTLCCLEPNLNVTKTCMVPLLIMNEFYRRHPERVHKCFLFCATHLMEKRAFHEYLNFMELYRDNKIEFYPRSIMPQVLDNMKKIKLAPAFVGHHIQNEQNYVTLEMLYLGYPMLHNSEYIRTAGYFYEGWSLHDGVRQLENVVSSFENDYASYTQRSQDVIRRHDTKNHTNLSEFKMLLSSPFVGVTPSETVASSTDASDDVARSRPSRRGSKKRRN